MGMYKKEIETIQTWFKSTAGLNSYREGMKATSCRPVAALEAPSNISTKNITYYQYVKTKRQYCRLYASNLDEVLDIQEKLSCDMEERYGTLNIKENNVVIGQLKNVKITFQEAGDSLIVPFDIEYEVTYSRIQPPTAPPANAVITKSIPRF